MSFGSPFNRKNNDDDDDYKDDSFDENEDADSDGDSPARPTSGTASPFNRAAPASPFRSDPPRTGGFGSAPVNRNDPKPASSTNTNNPPPRAGVGANSPFGGNSSFNRSSDRNASDRNADDKAATGTKPPASNTNNSNTNNPPRPNSPFGSNNPGSSSGNNPNNPPRPNNPGSGNNPGGTSGNAGGGSGFNRPAGSNPGSSSGSNPNNPARPNSPFGSNNPAGGSGSTPNTGNAGGGSGFNRPAGSNPAGSSGSNPNNPARPNSPFGGNNPGGSGSSTSNSGNTGGSRPIDDKSGGSKPAVPANVPARPGGGLFGGSRPADNKQNAPQGAQSQPDKKPDASSTPARPGGGLFGNRGNDQATDKKPDANAPAPARVGGLFGNRGKTDDQPADKKPDANAPAPARVGGLFGNRGKTDDQPADKKPDANAPAPARVGGLFGNRGKTDDQPADKKPDANAPAPERVGGLFGNRGKTDDQAADKKPDANPPAPARAGGLFGGFGKKADADAPKSDPAKPAANTGSRPAASTTSAPAFGTSPTKPPTFGSGSTPPSSGSAFGSKPAGGTPVGSSNPLSNKPAGASSTPYGSAFNKPTGAPVSSKPAAKAADAKQEVKPAGGLFGNLRSSIAGRMPGNAAMDDAKTARTADKKAPGKQARPLERKPKTVVVQRNFSQDHQLDIVGIALVLFGIVMFFGVISSNPNEGAITGGIVKLLSQLSGYGRYVWPIPCIAAGGWLILRHFRDEPPILEHHRLIGWIMLLLALMTTLQFAELLQKPVPTMAALAKISTEAWEKYGRGGGWIGDKLYMLIETMIGDAPTAVVLVGWWIVSVMLAFSITLAELTSYALSIVNWFSRARGGYVERRQQAMAAATLVTEATPTQVVGKTTVKAPALAAVNGGRKPAEIAANTVGSVPLATPIATPAAASAAPIGSTARGLFSRTPSQPVPVAEAVAIGSAAGQEVANVATPPPARSGFFGGRSTPSPPATETLQPNSNPLTPRPVKVGSTADNIADPSTSDKPAAPKASPAAGLFGSRPSMFGGGVPKVEDKAPDKVTDSKPVETPSDKPLDDKPAAPKSPVSGLFGGSRPSMFGGGAPKVEDKAPDKVADSKPVETLSDKPSDDKPAAPKSPVSGLFGSSRPSMFGGGAPKVEDKAPDKVTDSKPVETPSDKPLDDKPAAPKAPVSGLFGGSRPSMFGGGAPKVEDKAPDKVADSKPVEALSDKPSDDKPAAPKSPVSGLFGGSRPAFSSSANSPASQATPVSGLFGGSRPAFSSSANSPVSQATPVKADDNAPSDDKPAAPKSPVSGLFGGSRPAFSSSANSSATSQPTPTKADDNAPSDDKPAVPKAPVSGMFGGSRPAFSSPATSQPTPAKADDNAPSDDKPAVPKSPVSGMFGGSRPAFSSSANSSATSQPTPTKADDNAPSDDKPAVPKSPVSGLFGGSRPAFSSSANSPAASQPTPAKTDDNAPLDDKPAVPKAPVSGLFGSSRPAFSSSANSPAASQPTPAKTDDNAPLDDKPAVPKAASVPISTAAKPETPAAPVIVSSKSTSGYELPDYRELLEKGSPHEVDNEGLLERARVIEDTLQSFGAPGKVVEINSGPVITQFGVEPDYLVSRQGKKTRVKVSSIAKLDADLALSLAARSIRIEAPVPGKGYVGIEVPNAKTALVSLRDIMDSDAFGKLKSKLRIGLGQSVDGAPIAADLTAMPHLLIAGTTGSGKSVCVNAIITSLLLENTPDDLKFIMVDPKRVELTGYNAIPHLVAPVVVDLERIVGVLKWVTREMDDRYKRFSQVGARHIIDFNGKLPAGATKLPYLVVVIDELADLMMLAPDETEKVLTRLAQMARATGIHLIVSTQRPSVDVVTGLIKANFPARISFAVASSIDSRVILDQPGAEKLLGRGDMLYQAPDAAAPVRMQGVYVSDSEINRITRYWKLTKTGDTPYMDLNAPSSSFTSIANGKSTFDVTEPVQSRGEKFGNGGSNSASNGVPIGNGTPKPIGAPNGSMNAPVPSTTSATGSSTLFAARPTATNVAEADEDDEMYVEAVDLVKKMNNKASISLLQRKLRIGYTRAALLIELMKTRGVIDASNIADGQSVSDENA